MPDFTLRPAEPRDSAAIVRLIRALADYEALTHQVQTTPELLQRQLFGPRPAAEALVAEAGSGELIGFALYFTNFCGIL